MSVRDEEAASLAHAGPSRSRNTTAQGSATTSERQEYTSLSSLGIGMPRSPRIHPYGGQGRNGAQPSWLAKRDSDQGGVSSMLYVLSELLHPAGGRDAPREGDSTESDEDSFASNARATLFGQTTARRTDEQTALLGTQPEERRSVWKWFRWSKRSKQQRNQSVTPAQAVAAQYGALSTTTSLRRKYVGECCCDPLEPITMQDWQARQGSDGSATLPAPQSMSTETLVQLRAAHAETMHTAGVSLATVAQICFALMALLAARYSTVLWEEREHSHAPDDAYRDQPGQPSSSAWSPASVWQTRAWISGAIWLLCAILVKVFRVPGGLLGHQKTRRWIWSRAAISACAVTCFTFAANAIPMADLVVVVYLAPMLFVLASHLFFTSKHPFRAQLVSLSIYLGLILVMQPTFLFDTGLGIPSVPDSNQPEDFMDGDGVPAMPLDSPSVAGLDIYHLPMSPAWGWLAASASVLLTFASLVMLDRRPDGPVTYQSVAANSAVLAIISAMMHHAMLRPGHGNTLTHSSGISAWSSFAMLGGTAFFSLAAQVFQDLAARYTAVCQMGLISFLQPVISTGFGFIFPNIGSDPLCLAGVVLILANVAWTWTPLTDDEILEEYI